MLFLTSLRRQTQQQRAHAPRADIAIPAVSTATEQPTPAMAPSAHAERTRVAAEAGCARSQFNLSLYLWRGREGVAKDETQSLAWLQRAAAQGLARAESGLGVRILYGWGVEQDDAAAVSWFSKAVAKGLAIAQQNLGVCLSKGRGCVQDLPSAINLYQQAAEQGDRGAQNNLAAHYYRGQGVARDYSEAIKWFSMAATQGCKESQWSLGKMCANGVGMKKKNNWTAKYFLKARCCLGMREVRRTAEGDPQVRVLRHPGRPPPDLRAVQTGALLQRR